FCATTSRAPSRLLAEARNGSAGGDSFLRLPPPALTARLEQKTDGCQLPFSRPPPARGARPAGFNRHTLWAPSSLRSPPSRRPPPPGGACAPPLGAQKSRVRPRRGAPGGAAGNPSGGRGIH